MNRIIPSTQLVRARCFACIYGTPGDLSTLR